MKRKLLKQTLTEWRTNLWLALELLIVSVVLWYVIGSVYVRITVYNQPLGFDSSNCYNIIFNEIDENSPLYDSTAIDMSEAKIELLRRIQARPEIEAAAYGVNARLYNGSNSGANLYIDSISTNDRYVVQRIVSPDFTRVFKIHGKNGESPEQLSQILAEQPNCFFASDNILPLDNGDKLENYIGRTFESKSNGPAQLELAGVLQTIRYDEFSALSHSRSILQPMSYFFYEYSNELVVRVKENMDQDFINSFMADAKKSLRVGNIYISGVQAYDTIRGAFLRSSFNEMRNYLVAMAFLALNVFLGLLGTFWFRTQQRTGEIAMRRVNGATRFDIFSRMMSEGMLLLTLVTPLALCVDWLIIHYELNSYLQDFSADNHFFSCAALTYILLALMIIMGILFPAIRAIHIQPAAALQEE